MYIRKGNANSTSFLLQAFETVIHFLNNLYNRLFLEFREPFNGKLILLNHFFPSHSSHHMLSCRILLNQKLTEQLTSLGLGLNKYTKQDFRSCSC